MNQYVLEMAQPYAIEVVRGNLNGLSDKNTFEFATSAERAEAERRLHIAFPLATFRRLTITEEKAAE